MASMIKSFVSSSIGKKQVMALTGLALTGFVLTHLLGNFLLFVGPDAFNMYGHKLTSNPAIYIAEAILVALFLSHIFMAVKLVIENKMARPQNYYMKTKTGRGSTFASSTMPITGFVLLIFLVTHIMHFKYGAYYTAMVDGQEIRDIYRVVIEYFRNPVWVAWYVFAMSCLGLHLSHGFQSAFQSLGFSHPKYNCTIKFLGSAIGLFVAFGFSSLAIYSYIKGA